MLSLASQVKRRPNRSRSLELPKTWWEEEILAGTRRTNIDDYADEGEGGKDGDVRAAMVENKEKGDGGGGKLLELVLVGPPVSYSGLKRRRQLVFVCFSHEILPKKLNLITIINVWPKRHYFGGRKSRIVKNIKKSRIVLSEFKQSIFFSANWNHLLQSLKIINK